MLKQILARDEVRDLFVDGEVINERVILGKKGSIRRPDKVIVKEDEVIVVDFKTGEQRTSDASQVREYMELLSAIYKKRVRGILIYLQPFDVKVVEST